jgi:hypothetical protein
MPRRQTLSELDLEAIKNRHLRPEQMEHRTFYEGHIVIDLAALVEEVEYLRKERPAVVAWLRGLRAIGQGRELYLVLRWAEAIERGEHRREEKP